MRRYALWSMLLAGFVSWSPSSAMEWIPVAATGSPAPGLPGETLMYPSAQHAFLGPGGSVRFLSTLQSEAPSWRQRFFYWAIDGSTTPPLEPEHSAVSPECWFQTAFVSEWGDLAIGFGSLGQSPECQTGGLLVPDENNDWVEILPVPDRVTPPGVDSWDRLSSGVVGMNTQRQVLVQSLESGHCCFRVRTALHFAHGTTTHRIVAEGETSATGAGSGAVVRYLADQGFDGPNEEGAIVFAARVGIDCLYDDCIGALYRWDLESGMELVVMDGEAAPGVDGASFAYVGSPLLSDYDESVVFYGRLAPSVGVGETNDEGVWIRDATATRLLFREDATTGSIAPPFFRNRDGLVAVGTVEGAFASEIWTIDEASGVASLRARGTDERPGGQWLGKLEILHLSDGGTLLLRSYNYNHYLVQPDGSLQVLTVEGQPMPFGPGDVRPTVGLDLAYDAPLSQFLLGATAQEPTPATALFYAVPEPRPSVAGWLTMSALANSWRRRSARRAGRDGAPR